MMITGSVNNDSELWKINEPTVRRNEKAGMGDPLAMDGSGRYS